MPDVVFLNGGYETSENATVSVEDRGFLFADGVYEVIRVYQGKPFALDLHLERLRASADGILLKLPRPQEEYNIIIQRLIRENQIQEGYVYGQVTRGSVAPRSHVFPPETTRPTELWRARFFPLTPPPERQKGCAVITLPDDRWNRCDLKTIMLLPNTIAREKAKRRGAFEAILLSPEGIVLEGAASNVFIVQGDTLYTHPLSSRILPGITRQIVLESCPRLGIAAREEPFYLETLQQADEVLITSTTIEIMPVISVDGQKIGSGHLGFYTRRFQEAFTSWTQETLGL